MATKSGMTIGKPPKTGTDERPWQCWTEVEGDESPPVRCWYEETAQEVCKQRGKHWVYAHREGTKVLTLAKQPRKK